MKNVGAWTEIEFNSNDNKKKNFKERVEICSPDKLKKDTVESVNRERGKNVKIEKKLKELELKTKTGSVSASK